MNEKLALLWEDPVFAIFQEITKIPHPSEHEQKLAEWIIDYAKKRQWPFEQDSIGNLLINVPSTNGLENTKPICLQVHLDMVCVDAQGNIYGEEKFPLKLKLGGEWLSAYDTTLGADNGIGIALALAVASNFPHGPLELLFTVQEENGLVGANKLELPINSKIMINLDTEDWQTFIIGCAGGGRGDIKSALSFRGDKPDKLTSWKITVKGLQGGHSGMDINKGLGNAILIMARILKELQTKFKLNLGSFSGGSKGSVIPSASEVIFATEAEQNSISSTFAEIAALLKNEFSDTEPKLQIELTLAAAPPKLVTDLDTEKIVRLILALPTGVLFMSLLFPGIVQTSCNIGVVNTDIDSDNILIGLMPRSSSSADLNDTKEKLVKICTDFSNETLSSFTPIISFRNEYPPWEPDLNSELLKTAKDVWDTFIDKLEVTIVHAGLECGILKNKFPGLDVISIGPDIKGAHSASEKVSISSVRSCYSFFNKLLDRLAKQ